MDQGSSLNFDFNSQAGVMSLLSAIRTSNLNPVEKNELRDLVFLYTNGGGDVSVRIALEQKLIAHKIQPTASASAVVAPSQAPVLSFGSSRPAPVFKDVSNQFTTPVANAPVPTPQVTYNAVAPQAPVQAVPVQPQAVYVQQPTQIPVQQVTTPIPVQQVSTQAYVPQPIPVVQPQPAFVPPQPQVQVQVPTQPAPVPAPVATPTPAVPPVTISQPAPGINYLDRIREIKSAVNSKVGNPVNLVDINNEVGREYMNALLDAMKKLSGGATSQVDAAMQRLEVAYNAVEVAVEEHNKAKSSAPSASVQETQSQEPSVVEPVAQAMPVDSQVAQPQSVVSKPVMAEEPVFIHQEPVSVFKLSPEEESKSGFITSEPEPAPVTPTPVPVSIPTPTQFSVPTPTPTPASVSTPAPTPSFTSPTPSVSSLASEQRLRTPQDLPTADSLATSSSGDPLNTKEIDDGLDQLLSDWSLFKKSGLFGTGPKGREHPLFKKIAGLQIPLVLAGRFEGSTQEIKQSITDYMNGWRYEQGIIYEQGETFEHYLRRVIKQILDLQKKRKPA